ncbi:hypothetical protein QFC19_002768 [Naganishia cerealis]|uniref:Uncharacterized protein n=1 Tax=Naganishia cerealis TaxID=610337 RepID=A0ACC2W9U8_9TREE|nr:hypothetical protein QFC19_002768 [Naganishia cerealis]
MLLVRSPHPPPPPPPAVTLFHHYFPSPARFPEYPAFIDGLSGRTITSTELRTDALRLGLGIHSLFSQTRTPRQAPPVALLFSPNSVDFPQIFFGCQSIKVITSLANASYTPKELAYQIKDSQPFIAFVHPTLQEPFFRAIKLLDAEAFHSIPKVYWAVPEREILPGLRNDVQSYERLLVDPTRIDGFHGIQAEADEAHDTALLCYSSGTTGLPKGKLHRS